uniref:peptidoglycan DD-metalloendopeptidase family protein n=1 Tax=uncultured Altererythrobacter sp. TaxID=500840 RepID=UPI002630E090
MAAADRFRHPLGDGRITPQRDGDGYYVAQGFDEPNAAIGGSYHLGADWNGEDGGNSDLGDPVFAIANGTIVAIVSDQSASNTGFGNYVIIRHDLETPQTINGILVTHVHSLYAHLDTVENFVVGQEVAIGQQIGTLGTSGASDVAHLHFEITLNNTLPTSDDGYNPSGAPDTWVDPVAFIEANLDSVSESDALTQSDIVRLATFLAIASYGGSALPIQFRGQDATDPDFVDTFNYDDNYRGFLQSESWTILTNQSGEGALNLTGPEPGEFTAGGLFRSTEGFFDNDQGEGSESNKGEALVATRDIGGNTVLVLSFRGSDGFDAAYEGQTFTADGLRDYYLWIRPIITAVAEYSQANGIDTVIVSGHSLGGTIADLFALADSDLFTGIDLHIVSLATAGIDPAIAQYEDLLGLNLANSFVAYIPAPVGSGLDPLPTLTQIGLPDGIASYQSIAHSEDRVFDPSQPGGLGLTPNSSIEENLHFEAEPHWSIALPNIGNRDVTYEGRSIFTEHGFGAEHNGELYWTNIDFLTRDPLFELFDGSQNIMMGIHDYNRSLDWSGDPTPLFQAYTGLTAFGVDNDQGDRSLLGTQSADFILGLSGNDSIAGSGGDDLLSGGEGEDIISGGVGSDRISGGSGWDLLSGGADRDWLFGDEGNDFIQGDAGEDIIHGGDGYDDLYGNGGADTFFFDITSLDSGAYVMDEIFDYNQGNDGSYNPDEGDVIDISSLIAAAGGQGQPDELLWDVQKIAGQSASHLVVDPDGAGTVYGWQPIAILHGVTSGAGVSVVTGSGGDTGPTIQDVSSAPGSFTISPSSRYVSEGDATTFVVSRPDAALAETVYISTTIDRGSINNSDYNFWLNVPVTFAAGEFSKEITINTIEDGAEEFPETFGLIVQSNPDQPASEYLASGSFTIIDDDFSGPSGTPTDGDDLIVGGAAFSNLNGGLGNDTLVLDYSSGTPNPDFQITHVYLQLAQDGSLNSQFERFYYTTSEGVSSWQNFRLEAFENFSITATNGNDAIYLKDGDDQVFGLDGNDAIYSGGGNDLLDGGDGDDRFFEVGVGSVIVGGAGYDSVSFNASTATEDLTLNLSTGEGLGASWTGIEEVSGTLGSGNDFASVGAAFSNLNGGLGNDTLVLDYSSGTPNPDFQITHVYLQLAQDGSLNSQFERFYYTTSEGVSSWQNFRLEAFENFSITATNGNDAIYLKDGDDQVFGLDGNDAIYSGGGNDLLDGG